MELVVLYPHLKNQVIAKSLLYKHKITWVKAGDRIPDTPLLVVAGGDGTINYAVNNISLEKTKLLIIPLGRGNVLANALNIHLKFPFDIINKKSREIQAPLLEVNGKLAVMGAGVGEGSKIMYYANPYSQLGISSYFVTGFRTIPFCMPLQIKVNGILYTDLLTIELSLWGTSSWGLPLTNLPSSRGPFLILVKGFPFLTALSFLTGHLPEWEGVTTLEGKEFLLESDEDIMAHIDGEAFITKKLESKLSDKRVTILAF